MKNILIVGMGSMGSALADGISKSGKYNVSGFDRTPTKVQNALGANTKIYPDVESASAGKDAVLMCVKPNGIRELSAKLNVILPSDVVVISVAAGVGLNTLIECLPNNPIFRVMPNTGAAHAASTSAIIGRQGQKDIYLEGVIEIFECVGVARVLKTEQDMHAALALAGSGPAFVLRALAAMTSAGVELGLAASDAQFFALGAFRAAVSLAEPDTDPHELIRRIASPGGTTIAGLHTLTERGADAAYWQAILDTAAKSKGLEDA